MASLRRKLQKDGELHRHDNVKVMQENMALIGEINSLRRELKLLKQVQKDKVSFVSLPPFLPSSLLPFLPSSPPPLYLIYSLPLSTPPSCPPPASLLCFLIFGDQDLTLSRMTTPKTAGMNGTGGGGGSEDISFDSTRIIEMQKEEIKRQRFRISELEVLFSPPSPSILSLSLDTLLLPLPLPSPSP